jgi:putative ABC transport system permease protein
MNLPVEASKVCLFDKVKYTMFKNYLKIAWRNVIRHKAHTIINVSGLALGITCCLFIFLWVQDEKSVDSFHLNGKNLYTVYQTTTAAGKINSSYTTPLRFVSRQPDFLLEDIKASVPEIKNETFYATGYELPWGYAETFQVGEKMMKMEGSRAGEDFFKMFDYPLIEGSRQTALKDITGIAISRKMAVIFFGSPANAMGKTLRFENHLNFIVTAVFEDLPQNSSLRFDYLFNWEAQKKLLNWDSNDFQTYIQLSEKADVKNVEAKINQLVQSRLDKRPGVTTQFFLQRFDEKYLHNIFVNGKPVAGRIEYIRIFSGVAIFILIIACINFMNLATARAVKRSKEIGLRKVVGSTRPQLIGQFLSEALFFSFIAMLVSIILLYLLLPAFNNFMGKHIVPPITQAPFWFSLILLVLITGLVAGSYPALYLSALKPVSVLKGGVRFSQGAAWFRKGLTVFQFILSITLIIATIIISRQVYFVQNTHLGYNRENLVYIRVEGELVNPNKYLLFRNRVSEMPGIAMVDRSTEAPHAMEFVVTDDINWQGKEKNTSIGFKPSSVGFDFIKLMNLKIVEGRDFSRHIAKDSSDAFMVNEEAVKQMGVKNPLGLWISAWKKRGHIIAVLKDYHTQSLREPIMPTLLDVKEYENFGFILIRTKAGQTKQALASLAQVYKDINPAYPFAYQFADDEYKKLYSNEQVISKLTITFATLAILISCLGLFGLVMFAAEQRIKEISVRKVLGASLVQIISLFSKDFVKLILIAFIIAAPLAWYYMNQWLQGFAYRIPISWWIFALAGFTSVAIALLTMSYQTIKAGMSNPVKSLRAE